MFEVRTFEKYSLLLEIPKQVRPRRNAKSCIQSWHIPLPVHPYFMKGGWLHCHILSHQSTGWIFSRRKSEEPQCWNGKAFVESSLRGLVFKFWAAHIYFTDCWTFYSGTVEAASEQALRSINSPFTEVSLGWLMHVQVVVAHNVFSRHLPWTLCSTAAQYIYDGILGLQSA